MPTPSLCRCVCVCVCVYVYLTLCAHVLIHYDVLKVDALMGLVAAFSHDFRMYWTRENIAHLQLFHMTGIWDGCIKCYLPTSPVHYIIASVVAALFLWHYIMTLLYARGKSLCSGCSDLFGSMAP